MSRYCSNCGDTIKESWFVCPNCRNILKKKEVSPPIPQLYLRPYSNPESNTYGTVALIFGLGNVLLVTFTIIILILPFMGIVAIVLGGMGLSRDDNKNTATIGLILGIVEIVLSGILIPLLFLVTL